MLTKSIALSDKRVKAIWYPIDYTGSDIIKNNGSPASANVNGMIPIVANAGIPSGRNLMIEVYINYEVIANVGD